MTCLHTLIKCCAEPCVFLAGQAQYTDMGRRFRRGGGDIEWAELLVPIAVISCAVGITWLVSRYLKFREDRNADSPQALFTELCHAHKLDWTNQQLLRALANAHGLTSPVQLFVEPERFDLDCFGNTFGNRRTQFLALRARLFDRGDENEA